MALAEIGIKRIDQREPSMTQRLLIILFCGLFTVSLPLTATALTRVSEIGIGTEANNTCAHPCLSENGQFVVFESAADNLVAHDTNHASDIFVADRKSGAIERVSVSADGKEGDNDSFHPSISADGRYIAYMSHAMNLVREQKNNVANIFLCDRKMHTTTRVTLGSDGAEANDASDSPAISADGNYITFVSSASNLDPRATDSVPNIFLYDVQHRTISCISVNSKAKTANKACDTPAISRDGALVVFTSRATNLDGDTAGVENLFLWDRQQQSVTRISKGTNDANADAPCSSPTISENGQFIAFVSRAKNLTGSNAAGIANVFLYDRLAKKIGRVSVGGQGLEANGECDHPRLSANGRLLVFASRASNLGTPPGKSTGKACWSIILAEADVNPQVMKNSLLSISAEGQQPANGDCTQPAISADGSTVGFVSYADNLGGFETNDTQDIYVADLKAAPRPAGKATGVKALLAANNAALLPLRATAAWLEATISYNDRTAELTMSRQDHAVVFRFKKTDVQIDGQAVTLDTPPTESPSGSFIPAQLLIKAFALDINYDADTHTVCLCCPPETKKTLLFGIDK